MKLLLEPYKYQQIGTDFAIKQRYSINGDKMGLGKSVQTISLAVKEDIPKTLIIAPAFLVPNWKAEIMKFTGEEAQTFNYGTESRFEIVSYDSVKKVAKYFPRYDFVACDEIHYLKNIQAKRTKAIHELISTFKPEYFLGLSGTPIKNRVPEFYSLLRLCWYGGRYSEFSKYAPSYWLFNKSFTKQKIQRFGGRKVTKWEGVKNAQGLKDLIKPVYIRRKPEDVLDLPDEIHQEVLMSEKARTDELLKTAWEAYEGKKESKSFMSGKAISALGKTDYTVEFVKNLLEEEAGVIIFTDHVQAAKKIASDLGDGARFITGNTQANLRQVWVDDLNEGRLSAIVATIPSLSVGVNITGVSAMVFNDFAWVPADMDQARKRIHRIGQTKTCRYYYIMASKYDQKIYNTLKKKSKIIAEVDV